MTRRQIPCIIAVLMGLLIAAAPGRAIDLGEGQVLLIADRVDYDIEANVITASGNVEVTRGERRLLTDILRYHRDTDVMEAEGNVALLEPTGDTLFADRITLSGDLREGVAAQLRARLVDNSLIAAEGGRRTGGNRTVLDRAVFSPCPLCPDSSVPPLWQISARRVIHDQAAQASWCRPSVRTAISGCRSRPRTTSLWPRTTTSRSRRYSTPRRIRSWSPNTATCCAAAPSSSRAAAPSPANRSRRKASHSRPATPSAA